MSMDLATGVLIFAVLVTVICLGGLGIMLRHLRRTDPKSRWSDLADR